MRTQAGTSHSLRQPSPTTSMLPYACTSTAERRINRYARTLGFGIETSEAPDTDIAPKALATTPV